MSEELEIESRLGPTKFSLTNDNPALSIGRCADLRWIDFVSSMRDHDHVVDFGQYKQSTGSARTLPKQNAASRDVRWGHSYKHRGGCCADLCWIDFVSSIHDHEHVVVFGQYKQSTGSAMTLSEPHAGRDVRWGQSYQHRGGCCADLCGIVFVSGMHDEEHVVDLRQYKQSTGSVMTLLSPKHNADRDVRWGQRYRHRGEVGMWSLCRRHSESAYMVCIHTGEVLDGCRRQGSKWTISRTCFSKLVERGNVLSGHRTDELPAFRDEDQVECKVVLRCLMDGLFSARSWSLPQHMGTLTRLECWETSLLQSATFFTAGKVRYGIYAQHLPSHALNIDFLGGDIASDMSGMISRVQVAGDLQRLEYWEMSLLQDAAFLTAGKVGCGIFAQLLQSHALNDAFLGGCVVSDTLKTVDQKRDPRDSLQVIHVSVIFYFHSTRNQSARPGPKSGRHPISTRMTSSSHRMSGVKVVKVAGAFTGVVPFFHCALLVTKHTGDWEANAPWHMLSAHNLLDKDVYTSVFLFQDACDVCIDHVGSYEAQGELHIIYEYQVYDQVIFISRRCTKLWRRWRLRTPCVRRTRRRSRRCSGLHILASLVPWCVQRSKSALALLEMMHPDEAYWGRGCVQRRSAVQVTSSGKLPCRLLFPLVVMLQFGGVRSAGQPGQCFGHQVAGTGFSMIHSYPTRYAKRSFNRARRRAAMTGGTMYRGKFMTAAQLDAMQISHDLPRQRPRPPSSRGKRLKLFSWNCGGLSQAFDSCVHWLHENAYDVAVIVETKWSFDSSWTDEAYHYVHSGIKRSGFASSGVLVMISTRLASAQNIRYSAVVTGRMLRVQFPVDSQSSSHMEVIALYQHVWDGQAKCLEDRSHILQTLSKTLHEIPARSQIVLAGDFNQTCRPLSRHVGSGVPTKSHASSDSNDLQTLIAAHQLVALNTWRSAPAFTFAFGKRQSQIDYIMIRLRDADVEARSSSVLRDFPLNGHLSDDAARHFPVCASIRAKGHFKSSGVMRNLQCDLQGLANAVQEADDTRLARLRQRVEDWCRSHEVPRSPSLVDSYLSGMNDMMREAVGDFFPKKHESTCRPWQDQLQTGKAKHMWQLFRIMRQQANTLQGIFQAWRCWAKFSKQHGEYRARARLLRRNARLQLLQDAREAAGRGDTWSLYKIVRRIAPKAPPRKFQVQPKGKLLTVAEEHDALVAYYSALYDTENRAVTQRNITEPVDISMSDVESAINSIPLRKSVDSRSAPGAAYRACADILTPAVVNVLQVMWGSSSVSVPSLWSVAELLFLPKPGQNTYEVKDWRPIGLQNPLGKAVMHWIIQPVKFFVQSWSSKLPLFAYMSGRCTTQALQKVFRHCKHVRDLCASHEDNLHRRFQGWRPCKLLGGLQICLDLSSAFDRVPWDQLEIALRSAEVPTSYIEMVMSWLEASQYRIQVGSRSTNLPAARGVKQGCRASPTLFLAYMALFCFRMDERCGAGWSRDHLTIYADDTHASWVFHSVDEFLEALGSLNVLMQLLQEMGMVLNDDKAKAILTVRGTLRQSIRKKYTKTVKQKTFLILPAGRKDRLIPLVSTAEYLGAIISYSEFESQTVKSRISKATHRWWQMQKLFCGRFGLTTTQRLQMWIVVIKPSLLYSLDCFPMPQTLLRQLQTCMMKHVRAITRCPSHISHVSDAELLRQYHLQSVAGYLQDSVSMQLRTCDSDVADRQWLTQIQQRVHEHQAGLRAVVRTIEPHSCPICGVYFDSRRSVKVHVARAHRTVTASEQHDDPEDDADSVKDRLVMPSSGQTAARLPDQEEAVINTEYPAEVSVVHQPGSTLALNLDSRTEGCDDDAAKLVLTQTAVERRPVPFSREIHSRNGRPTCSGCGKDFTRWDHLRKHITKGYCKVFAPVSTSARSELQRDSEIGHREAVPMVSRPHVLETLQSRGFLGLISCCDVLQELRQRCALCHTWIAHTYMMKNHYRNTHSEFFREHSKQCEKMCHELGTAQVGEPCAYCDNRVGERIHLRRCTPLWQCAVLCVRHANGHSGATGGPGVLRGCRSAIQPGSQAFAGDARAASGATQAAAQQGRKRQRDKGPPSGWYLQQRRRSQGLDDACASPGETRRQHSSSSSRHGTSILGKVRSSLDHTGAASLSQEVAREGRTCAGEAGEHALTGSLVRGNPTYVGQHPRGARQGSGTDSEVPELRMVDSGQMLGIPKVGSRSASTSGRREQEGQAQHTSSPGCSGNAKTGSDGSGDTPFPCHKETGHVHIRGAHSHHGPECAGASRDGSTSVAHGVSRVIGVSVDRPPVPAGLVEAQPIGGALAEAIGAQLKAMVLRNPGNLCYINTVIRSLAWTSWMLTHDMSLWGALGQLLSALVGRAASSRNGVQVLGSTEFSPLLRHWSRPSMQHDALEFLLYLLRQANVADTLGEWQARRQEDGEVGVVDRGVHVLLVLPPRRDHSIHVLLNAWQSGPHVVGYTHAPAVVLIQVGRFLPDGSGRLRRHTNSVQHLLDVINLPVFMQELQIMHVQYKPVAALCHYGGIPTSGHYVSFLLDSARGEVWKCDDNMAPIVLSLDDAGLNRHAYGLLYIRI